MRWPLTAASEGRLPGGGGLGALQYGWRRTFLWESGPHGEPGGSAEGGQNRAQGPLPSEGGLGGAPGASSPPASCRPPCITSPPPTASRSSSLAVGPGRLGRLPCGPVPTRPLPSLGPGQRSSQRRGQDGGLLSQRVAALQICYLRFWGSGIQPRQAGASALRSREAAPGHLRGLWPTHRLHLKGPGSLGVVGRIRFLGSS